ncbi:MAG: allophanate hydrolase [Actinomycetota bacterium]
MTGRNVEPPLVAEIVGGLDPRERVAAAADAVAAIDDPAVFISLADANAAVDAVDPALPLAGVTFAVKNNIDVAGVPTTAGCPSYAYLPESSAPAVGRLIDAGATCLGVTNLDQFATGLVGTRSPYGVPVNPIDPRLVPGGSSSGSAVAVARHLVDFALGTDTAGSGRVPAAQTRIVGVKPTRGRVPTTGVVPAVRSIDCVSFFSRSVDIAALAMSIGEGVDTGDPFSRPAQLPPLVIPTLRVGVPAGVSLDSALDEAAWTASIERLAALPFVEIVECEIADFVQAGTLLYDGPWVAERYAAVGAFLDGEPADADPTVAGIIRSGARHSATDAYRAMYHLADLQRRSAHVWRSVDVVITPTTPGVATLDEVGRDPVGRNSRLGHYTNWVNLLDQAAVAVPGTDRADGWPFGVTFCGPAWSDDVVIELARRFVARDDGAAGAFSGDGGTDVVVVGAHLRGQPLNWQLTDLGGRFVRSARTTPDYRLYALESSPPKPALVRAPGPTAGPIEVEVWRLPTSAVGRFVSFIPAPLGLGRVQLDDGTAPTGFIAESIGHDGAVEITDFGGWRAYLAR